MAFGILATVVGALLVVIPFAWGSAKPQHTADAPGELEAEDWPDSPGEWW